MPYANLTDAEIYYEVTGHGPPLLLVSGLGGNASFWAPNVAALAQNHSVIVHDHRGTGRSTRAEQDYSVEQMADDTAGLLAQLNLRHVAMIGHSTGAAIGHVLAATRPGLIGRLMLYGSWAKLCPQMRQCMEVRQQLLLHGGPAAYHRSSPLFLYPPAYICEAWAEIEQEIASAAANSTTASILDARIRAILAYDGETYLPAINIPTEILVAQDDILTPPLASAWQHARMPGAVLTKLPYGGHAASRTVPTAFNDAALRFLWAEKV